MKKLLELLINLETHEDHKILSRYGRLLLEVYYTIYLTGNCTAAYINVWNESYLPLPSPFPSLSSLLPLHLLLHIYFSSVFPSSYILSSFVPPSVCDPQLNICHSSQTGNANLLIVPHDTREGAEAKRTTRQRASCSWVRFGVLFT